VKGTALEVYRDAGKPAVSEVGHAAGSIIKLLLWPVRTIVDNANAALDRLGTRVEKKLGGLPTERLIQPAPTIAAPAALQYALLGESDAVDDLREMFENLLVTSMDRTTAQHAHPAFVSMISQITPDEAWILKSIDAHDYALIHVYRMQEAGNVSLGFRTLLGIGIGIDESRLQQYISNLDRLGILRIQTATASDPGVYETLGARLEREFQHEAFPGMHTIAGSIEVTPLGRLFLSTCVRPSPG
jgi:hypothetical protein